MNKIIWSENYMDLYFKLAAMNIKKDMKDYVLYLTTVMLSSSLFFAFLSLTSDLSPFRQRGADDLT